MGEIIPLPKDENSAPNKARVLVKNDFSNTSKYDLIDLEICDGYVNFSLYKPESDYFSLESKNPHLSAPLHAVSPTCNDAIILKFGKDNNYINYILRLQNMHIQLFDTTLSGKNRNVELTEKNWNIFAQSCIESGVKDDYIVLHQIVDRNKSMDEMFSIISGGKGPCKENETGDR